MPERTPLEEKYNRFNGWKVLAHSEKIRQIIDGGMPAPVEWVVYPSNVCSYKCGHCIMAEEQVNHKTALSKVAMEKIPVDAERLGIKCVIFSGGGDPMLNPYTMESARELKRRGIMVGINNQGYFLNDPTPFNFVRYSVDAATKDTYYKIHKVDGWERVNQNIQKLADLRAQGEKIDMGLAFLITPFNWFETYDFCKWAQQYNPDFMHLRPAFLDSGYLDKEYPDGDGQLRKNIMPELAKMKKQIESEFPNAFYKTGSLDSYWGPKTYSKCRSTPLMAVLGADGSFLICQDVFDNRWGNYNEMSFEECWFTEEHKAAIERINLKSCPRCVEYNMNEIIEHVFVKDSLKVDLI
jgi:MoaA/NifB/PqqE/SkfB family radical SAM enzyme